MKWNGNALRSRKTETLSKYKNILVVSIIFVSCFQSLHTSEFLFSFSTSLAKDCGVLKIPLNGSIVGPKMTTFPNSLTFTCDKGFELKGSRVRHCEANALWSGNETFCQGELTRFHPSSRLQEKLEQFSIECRKFKTKVITLANHKGQRQSSEPIKT